MNELTNGLMSHEADDILSYFRSVIVSKPQTKTLKQRLQELTSDEAKEIASMAKMVRLMAQMQIRSKGYLDQTYADLTKQLYRGLRPEFQNIVAALLEEFEPVEVRPKPKFDRNAAAIKFYAEASAKMEAALKNDLTVGAKPAAPQQPQRIESNQAALFADEVSPEGPDAFLMRIAPKAIMVAQELGIDPRIVVAQAALETGWGNSVKGNNLFGIKSHGKADGLMVQTQEVLGGKRQKIKDSFRQYESFDDSIEDYGLFLRENKRYQPMLEAETLDEQITALGKSGYATDPEYAKKIADIAKSKRLEVLVSS